jgi:SAM-dependent MidA family methyltransferase
VTLVELGPGRGTLMCDALRATRRVPGFREALSVTLVEANPVLEAVQRSVLDDASTRVTWASHVAEAAGPAIVIANEFFDCLPVRQFVAEPDGWRTRRVGLDEGGQLQFVAGEPADADVAMPAARSGTIGELADYGPIAASLATLKSRAVLVIDYGDTPTGPVRIGDTLQAVRGHGIEHPLTSPGEADLTAQVDFRRLADDLSAATGLVAEDLVTQATFLGRLGAVERASRLMAANPARAAAIEAAVARLMAPAGMGGRFKVLALRPADAPTLPGFEGRSGT